VENRISRSVSLPAELDRQLVRFAEAQDRPVSAVIQQALEAYFMRWLIYESAETGQVERMELAR
jgi:predicted transcriptional regulator